MKKRDKNKPATLSEWLEIATRGLAAPGKERITREIEAHYAEAVQAHVPQGEPVQSAEAGIIADLGDPKVAARRFRRGHFTTLEAKCIANLSRQRGEIPALILGYLPPVIWLLFALFITSSKLFLFVIVLLFALMICPTISFFVSRRPVSQARTLSLLWLNWVNGLAAAFVLLFMLFVSRERSDHFTAMVLAMFMFGHVIPSFLTWNRARKMTDEFDETTGVPG